MSELQWFQRYHTKENVHSSNAMFLLKRLYFYSPIKFFKTLNAIFDTENVLSMPNFIFQDTQNGKGSIPDFSIMQDSFKIIVEAKEGGKFNYNQLPSNWSTWSPCPRSPRLPPKKPLLLRPLPERLPRLNKKSFNHVPRIDSVGFAALAAPSPLRGGDLGEGRT